MKLRSFIPLFAILWVVSGTARSDEFSVVAAGDPMYTQVAAITKAGWLNTSPEASVPANAHHLLTRYELALETAKAIFMVTARHRADAAWAATVPRPALRALRDLTSSLRVELKKLDVDAVSTLALLDTLLKPLPSTARGSATGTGGTKANFPLSNRPSAAAPASGRLNGLSGGARSVITRASLADIPFSQRLRLTTTLLALARDADDGGYPTAGGRPIASGLNAGAQWNITDWLSLRTDYHRRLVAPNSLAARVDPFGSLTENRLGGGVDIALLNGVKVSGNLARVSADSYNLKGTRMEGGLGFTTWQDRLSLTANLSRLMPEDSLALSSTAAGLNVDVDITQSLSLNLLYKQLFGPQNATHADRFVGGGISINF